MENRPRYIVIHCTDVSRVKQPVQFYAVNRYHEQQGFPQSASGYFGGYHVLIEPDGTERRYRNDTEEGAHTKQVVDGRSMNLQSLGVCLSGDFDVEFPSDAQVNALRSRIKKWMADWAIDPADIRFHRAFNTQKSCPGSLLDDAWLKSLTADSEFQGKPDVEQAAKRIDIPEFVKMLDSLRALLAQLQSLLA